MELFSECAIFCGKANGLVLLREKKLPTAFYLKYLEQILERKAEKKDEVVISGKVLHEKCTLYLENHHLKVSTTANNRISASVLSNPTFQANLRA